jgi:ribosomal protein L18E
MEMLLRQSRRSEINRQLHSIELINGIREEASVLLVPGDMLGVGRVLSTITD